MVNQRNYSKCSEDLQAQAAQELVTLLLETDELTYPWNPFAPESEAYLAELEQAFLLDDWSAEEITARSQNFFSQLDQLQAEYVPSGAASGLQVSLFHRFAERIPQTWLDAIATKATQLLHGQDYAAPSLSLAEQLVQCVQQLLPNWAEDDLAVLARPLAYAMRGMEAETIDLALGTIRPIDWTELSELEQARLSLAVARYALAELEATDDR